MRGFAAPGWTVVRPLAGAALRSAWSWSWSARCRLGNHGGTSADARSRASDQSQPARQRIAARDHRLPAAAAAAASAAPDSAALRSGADSSRRRHRRCPALTPAAAALRSADSGLVNGRRRRPDQFRRLAATPSPRHRRRRRRHVAAPTPTGRDAAQRQSAGRRTAAPTWRRWRYGQPAGTAATALLDSVCAGLIAGLVIAFLALLALGLMWGCAAATTDPLVR